MHTSSETSPLLDIENDQYSWKACLDHISYAWPLVWLDRTHRYKVALCAVISLLQLLFYARVPYLLGSVVGEVSEPGILMLLIEFIVCVYVRDCLCDRFRSCLWQPYALRSQQLIAERIQDIVFRNPENHHTWSSGGFLSDFNKGGSLNSCLEKVLFTWIPISLKLLMTTMYVWELLGPRYGVLIASISLLYICFITRNALRSISWNRRVVRAKRHKDAVA